MNQSKWNKIICGSSHSEMFFKIIVFKISQHSQDIMLGSLFNKVAGLEVYNFIKKEILAQVFSCEYCKIFQERLFYRTIPVAASEYTVFSISQEICALLKWIEIPFNMSNSYFSVFPSRFNQKSYRETKLIKDEFFKMEECFAWFTMPSIVSSLYPLTHLFLMHPFSTSWKHQKTVKLSDVFRG